MGRRNQVKKLTIVLAACFLVLGLCAVDNALAVSLVVDTAPNVYGSPDWDPWWEQAKEDVVDGTFDNMRTGYFPGTLCADPYDEIVYSTMDLGQRLHWIYWIEGVSIADLQGNFEVKWSIDWGGDEWTYEGGGWAADGDEVGWSQPSSWEEYNGGVIGSLGFAWWSTDNDAPPFDTGGSPYDEVDQADIDALRADILKYQTHATGQIRYKDADGSWVTETLRVEIKSIPDAATVILLGSAMAVGGLFGRRRRDRKG
jgi:hypothetical protein